MFQFLRPKQADVISHWYTLVPNLPLSVSEFYTRLEEELKARKVPGLEMSRVLFAEGGPLSADRTYLRMQREALVFDICAAPFGTSFFFSCRFGEVPVAVTIWHLLSLVFAVGVLLYIFLKLWSALGFVLFILTMASLIYVLRNAVALGLKDLDGALIKMPVVGPVYMRFLRKETYYRHDTRLMYCDTVNQLTKDAVQAVTGANGIELIRFNEYSPLLEELYKPRFVRPVETTKK